MKWRRRGQPTRHLSMALVGAFGATGCMSARPDPASTAVFDTAGQPHLPLQVPPGTVHVLVFLSQECPIANGYAPTLQQLAQPASAPDPNQRPAVRWFLVHVDPDLSAAAAREHAAAFGLPGTVLLDPPHRLAQALGITRTPEAAVLSPAGLCYRGRVDDQWAALGSRRPAPTCHDLRAAIERAQNAGATPGPWPAAVGCLLPEPARQHR